MNNYNFEKAIENNHNEQNIQSLNQKLSAFLETKKNLETELNYKILENNQLKLKLGEHEKLIQLNQNNNFTPDAHELRQQLKIMEENKKSIETKFKYYIAKFELFKQKHLELSN